MSDPSTPKFSDKPLVNFFKKLFAPEPKVKPTSCNEALQPWLTTLTQHLQLYLQSLYLEIKPGFFAELFANSKKQTTFSRLLFSNDPNALQEILLHPHVVVLWSTPHGRLAMQATYFSIIKPLEGFDANILKKPAIHPLCNALLQQLLKNFARICTKLDKNHGDPVLLPILKDSYLQLAVLANQSVDITADENLPAIYQNMQTKVDLYLAKHPRIVKAQKKTAANDASETTQQVVGNTVQFP